MTTGALDFTPRPGAAPAGAMVRSQMVMELRLLARNGEQLLLTLVIPLLLLVMGTRSADIDPAILYHLHRRGGFGVDDLDRLLNKESGLLGLAGTRDMRDVLQRREDGDAAAGLAFDVYVHRLKGYVGAYYAQLGGVDVISFTAGVGENAPLVRAATLAGLERLGIEIDAERNEARSRDARWISADDSEVAVLVIPTDEELEIARQALAVVEG